MRATAATLGIEALLDRKPAQLSGGQRQRVALGRAIVREPKAFLLDEPLSNLDPLLRVATRTELALLHRRLAATMVYVTHDQEEAMTLGTRVAVMRDGAIEQVAPALELFRTAGEHVRRRIRRVAGDEPVAGRLPAPRRTGPRRLGGVLDRSRRSRPRRAGRRRARGRRAAARHRPTSDGDGTAGRVEIVEPLGPVTLVHLRVDGLPGEFVRVVVPADTRIGVGDHARFRIRRDRLHLFDGRTGRRLN